MALEARGRVKVGRREYFRGERLTPEDEAEMRRRPGFSLMIEEGHLVEVKESPKTPEPPPNPPEPQVVDPMIKALDALGPAASTTGNPPSQEETVKRLTCPHCDYSTDKQVNLRAHIRRNHEKKKKRVKSTGKR